MTGYGGIESSLKVPKLKPERSAVVLQALFKTHGIEELEPLLVRFREAAQEESQKSRLGYFGFQSVLFSARLHEVRPCMSAPRVGTPALFSALAFHHSRSYMPHAPPRSGEEKRAP